MAWAAVGKAAFGAVKGMAVDKAKKIGKSKVGKLFGREKNVMKGGGAAEASGDGGSTGGALAIRPSTALVASPGGALTKTSGASVGGDSGGGGSVGLEQTVYSIKAKVIKVENLLAGSLAAKKKRLEEERQRREEAKGKKDEASLEKSKPPKTGGKFKMPKVPGAGLLGGIVNFISTLALGWFAVQMVDWLPHLTKILPALGSVVDWFLEAGIWILDGLGTLINWGYKLVDGLQGFVGSIFGEEGAKKFGNFMSSLKNLVAGFLVWKIIGEKIFKTVVANIQRAFKLIKGVISRAFKLAKGALKLAGKALNWITGGQVGKIAQGAMNLGKNLLGKAGGVLSKFTGAGAKAAGAVGGKIGGMAAKIFGKAAKFIAPALKAATPAVKGFAKRIPILGPLIVAIVSLMTGEPIGQALFKGIGAALGGALGTLIPIPFIGTLLGETIGVFVGDLLYHLIIKRDPAAAFDMLKSTIMGIFNGGKAIVDWLLGGGLFGIMKSGADLAWRFGKWIFFDAIPWVFEKLGGAAKLITEWFKKGMERFVDNFPVFDLPLMKFGIGPINVDINWLLGKSFGQIPWFKQWVNGEDQLMHFPDFSMFVPILGLPFLIGHVGKSLFPGSFFDGWPSGVSAAVNPIGKALGAKIDEGREKAAAAKKEAEAKKEAFRQKVKEKGYWGAVFDKGDKKDSSKRYSKEEFDKMHAEYKANPTTRGAMKLNLYAKKLKAQNQKEFGGTGEAFTFGNKTYQPGDKGYAEAINAAKSAMHGDNTAALQLSKLQEANENGGAQKVIDSISTTASYDEPEIEIITVPTSTEAGPKVDSSNSSLAVTEESSGDDPYEVLDFAG